MHGEKYIVYLCNPTIDSEVVTGTGLDRDWYAGIKIELEFEEAGNCS